MNQYFLASVVFGCFLLLAQRSNAQRVSYDGVTYELVNWDFFSGGVANGNTSNGDVTFDAFQFQTGQIFSFEGYSVDDGFDNLSFLESDEFETIRFFGGFEGESTFSVTPSISELLLLIGAPGDMDRPSQFGPGVWGFDSSLSVEIIDTEVVPEGNLVVAQNVLDNTAANMEGSPDPFHISGVVKISSNSIEEIVISQQDSPGQDVVNATFAIPIVLVLGDVNLDGFVNLLDVAPFVEVLTSGSFQLEADINGDGQVNLLDVAPFVELLTGG